MGVSKGLTAFVMVLAAFPAGCASYPTLGEIAQETNSTLSARPLFLVPADVIEVRFPQKPEWTHTSEVRRDGRASFLFVGELVVAGKTLSEVEGLIRKTYSDRKVISPVELTVNLTSAAVRSVVVMGEVYNPGVVEMTTGHLTFLEAIGKAGGPRKDSADLSETMLVRWLPAEQKTRVWRFDARLDNWQSGTPVFLQAHDVIFIPNTMIDEINIWVDKYIRQNLPIPLGIPVAN